MRPLRISTTILAAISVAAIGFLAPMSASAAPPGQDNPLSVQETGSGTQLTFGHSRTFIAASSRSDAANKRKADIEVNGKAFTAKLDKKTSAVTWGGGGRTLDPADVAALKA